MIEHIVIGDVFGKRCHLGCRFDRRQIILWRGFLLAAHDARRDEIGRLVFGGTGSSASSSKLSAASRAASVTVAPANMRAISSRRASGVSVSTSVLVLLPRVSFKTRK